MMQHVCWICNNSTMNRRVKLRSKKDATINHCLNCNFDFFIHENRNLLSSNQLDKTRLEAAGLDIPSVEKDFKNGYDQSKSYIQEYITENDAGHNILEIGCSWGYFLKSLQERGCHAYGLEINPVRSEYVKSTLKLPCFNSLDDIFEKPLKFRKIFSFYCLEYIEQPIIYFKKLLSILEPGGEMVLITPNLQDVLKDIWSNSAYQNFFYDECAITYYSIKAVNNLMAKLQESVPNISYSIQNRQGYSLYNHLYWHFNQRPLNNNTLVGGDQLADNIYESINNESNLSKEIATLLDKFSIEYKQLIEHHNYGNQIIIRIQLIKGLT